MLRFAFILLAALLMFPAALSAQTVNAPASPAPNATPPSHDALPPPAAKSMAAPSTTPGAPTVATTSTTVKGPEAVTTKTTTVTINDPENTLYLDTTYGRVIIQLHPDWAPKTVIRIKQLVRLNFYDGLLFHRVIDGFMAQTGDPKGDGTGGSGVKLSAEFNPTHHARGIVSMARASDPDSADSQFFIVTGDAGFLDNQYTAFGQVVSGMEFVDMLHKGSKANNGMVAQPDKILHMRVAADVKG